MQLKARYGLGLFNPIVFQVMQSLPFALGTYHVMEFNCVTNALFDGKRTGAEVFKFANILARWVGGSQQWIDFSDFIFLNVKHATTKRGAKPLVQGRTHVGDPQVFDIVRKMCKGMGGIQQDLNTMLRG